MNVSVVMGTYNGQRFVAEQLQSILRQTLTPREIIISDDGSSDDTLDVVDRVLAQARSDITVTIHRNRVNLGFADNFLQACRQTSATHIAFCDQDDVWHPEKLERQVAALHQYEALLCVHRVRYVDVTGNPLPSARPSDSRPPVEVIDDATAPPWGNFLGMTMLFDRALLEVMPAERRGLDPYTEGSPLSHDRWLYFLGASFGRIVVLPEVLADYRQHADQLYGGEKGRSLRQRLRDRAATGCSQSDRLASIASHRVGLLRSVADHHSDAATSARRWERLADHYTARSRLLGRTSVLGRVTCLGDNVLRGRYVPASRSGLGLRGFAEDAVMVLTSGQSARRRSTPVGGLR